jgi:hypothetical protein
MPAISQSFDLPPERAAEIARQLRAAIPKDWMSDPEAWDGAIEQALFSKPRRGGGAHVAHCHIVAVPYISSLSSDRHVRPPMVKLSGPSDYIAPLLAVCASLGLKPRQPAALAT